MIMEEVELVDRLRQVGVPTEKAASILEHPTTTDENLIFDLRGEAVLYINNLEKDYMYKRFYPSVHDVRTLDIFCSRL